MTNREFWIQKGTPDLIADSFQEAEGFCIGHRSELPVIHVVEASTYAALEAQLAETKRKLEIAKAALKESQETFHYVYCMSDKSHAYFCIRATDALAKLEETTKREGEP